MAVAKKEPKKFFRYVLTSTIDIPADDAGDLRLVADTIENMSEIGKCEITSITEVKI